MSEILTATHGIAPRSDELLRIGGDVERGRLEQLVYDEKLAEETDAWLQLQFEYGIDIKEDGKLGWQDHLRPIIKSAIGFAPDIDDAPVTRWGSTNTFYRKPTICGWLSLNEENVDVNLESPDEHISLLAPFSFASLCENTFDQADPVENTIGLYADLIEYLHKKGLNRVTLLEVVSDDFSDTSPKYEHVSKLARVLAQLTPGISIGYLNTVDNEVIGSQRHADKIGAHISPSSLSLIASIDDFASTAKIAGNEIWSSVINASSTVKDTSEYTQTWIDNIRQQRPGRVILTHTTDLQYLPLPFAQEKIKYLSEAKQQLIDRLGE